ncbi:MAG: universal stress protein [Candidatus Methylomirabilales bacterium]
MSVGAHITRILVPTDFSPSAAAACELAARLATRAQADLVLFHAFSGLELLEEIGRGRGKPQVEVLDDVYTPLKCSRSRNLRPWKCASARRSKKLKRT